MAAIGSGQQASLAPFLLAPPVHPGRPRTADLSGSSGREEQCQHRGVGVIEGVDAGAADHAGDVALAVGLHPGRAVVKAEMRSSREQDTP